MGPNMCLSGFQLHFATGFLTETKHHDEEHCIRAIVRPQPVCSGGSPACSLSWVAHTCGGAKSPPDGGIVLALTLKFYATFSVASPSGLTDMTLNSDKSTIFSMWVLSTYGLRIRKKRAPDHHFLPLNVVWDPE